MTGAISLGVVGSASPKNGGLNSRIDRPVSASTSRWVALISSRGNLGRHFSEIWVSEGVIADLMTLGKDALHEARDWFPRCRRR